MRTSTVAVVAALAALGAATPQVPIVAGDPHLDPASLPVGAAPRTAHLVGDTIRDGRARIDATSRGEHDALWEVGGGYVVRDHDVGPRRLVRVVLVSESGERRVVARSRSLIPVAVSPSGRRAAVQVAAGQSGLRSVVSVIDPRSGRTVARREVRLATLAAVTDHRVLLGLRARWRDPATVWWSYARDRLMRIAGQAATSADVRHDKVVLDDTGAGEFCHRVAVLSRPAQTLWRSCAAYPHEWSPDGRHALTTHTYFDAAGTDRWWVADGRTGTRAATVTGRLDWDAAWEDRTHFLTLAQGDDGQAGIVRCDLAGACERASRLWDVPVPSEPSVFYDDPPVVLAAGRDGSSS